ncbi:MAG TPA: DUF998 domain-containing protein [Xanthomonadaceae bacterium]|nr:DUF998 domain-containing protein [Xanthomonadaceae bacterium]
MKNAAMAWSRQAGALAGLVYLIMLVSALVLQSDYRLMQHPPALLGAVGVPGSSWWNMIAQGACGVLATLACWQWRERLAHGGAGLCWRLAAMLLLLSALAFAALGLLPLDPGLELDEGPNRLHIAAWMLWWIAFAAASGLAAAAAWPARRALGAVLLALAIPSLLYAPVPIGTGTRQLGVLLAWFTCLAALPRPPKSPQP